MVPEGSCDAEDWSNDAENTALITEINYSLADIDIENSCFYLQKYFKFLLYFWSNKCIGLIYIHQVDIFFYGQKL